MKPKNRGLPNGKGEIPLLPLSEGERIKLDFVKQRRLLRPYRLYLATAATVIVLALAVLLMGFDGGRLRDAIDSIFWHHDLPDEQTDTIGEGNDGVSTDESSESSDDPEDPLTPDQTDSPEMPPKSLYDFDYSAVPKGEIPILPMDLSLLEYGPTYIQNLTGLKPDLELLLNRPLSKKVDLPEYLSSRTEVGPKVLIVHTHASEAYSKDGAISCTEEESAARSLDSEKSVIAVGKVLADSLNCLGISTVHCQVKHDDTQYKGAYERAGETISRYLEQYPSICLVVDLHRDAIVKSSGELIRPVTLIDGEAAAQVMCVVGSEFGGESNPNWEGNLAFALQLRNRINSEYGNLCRPPYLKSQTYNQELAPYSILLEIGSSGNSVEEAKRSAAAVANVLAEMLGEMADS